MQVEIKILNPVVYGDPVEMAENQPMVFTPNGELLPHYATAGSAAVDLRAAEPCIIKPLQCVPIRTALAIHMLSDTPAAALILPRSGLGGKNGLILGNSMGLIDQDYQGELVVFAYNRNADQNVQIDYRMRFAQLMFIPVIKPRFTLVDQFSVQTARGEGGLGHTGSA